MRLLITLMLILFSSIVVAGSVQYEFDDVKQETRFISLSEELRCLVCQNQSLADSNAALAQDLRSEVFKQIKQGKTDEQIIDFLVSRYGDFVLYEPPMNLGTVLLWFSPLILLILIGSYLFGILRQQKKQSQPELNTEQQAKINALLNKVEPD